MENQQKSIGANALIFGAVTGAALIVYSLLLFILNLYMNTFLGYLNYVIMVGGMVWGTLQYRKQQSNGLLSYGKAFTSSFLIGVIASVISIIYFFIYIKFINTGLITEMLEQTRLKMEAKSADISEEQMEKALAITAKFMQPGWMVVFGLLMYLFFSAVFAALTSIFLKKEDKSIIPTV
jgi:hypothetical protein